MVSRDNGGEVLRKLDARLSRVEDWLDMISAFFIVFIMMFATAQVFSRKFLPLFNPDWGGDLWGYIDIVVMVMAAFSFLGIAYCQRLGGHIRMELLVRRLRGRALWIAEAIGVTVALLVMLVLMWYGYEFFLARVSTRRQHYRPPDSPMAVQDCRTNRIFCTEPEIDFATMGLPAACRST